MNRIGRRIGALVFLIGLFALCGGRFSSYALSEEHRTVRVAYPIQTGLTDVDESGNYTGYTYEYLEEIAQYTGWDYEFVQVEGTTDEQLTALMEMVENGEVDLMGAMLYNKQMGELVRYASYSYGTVETVLQVPEGKADSLVIDSQVLQNVKIAVGSTAGPRAEELSEFCQMNQIEPHLIVFGSDEEMVRAVEDGRADAMLSTSMNYREGLRTIARFAPKPVYFVASQKSDPEILAELNDAIVSISQMDPYFQTTLYEKYFSPQYKSFTVTEEDRAYIQSIGTVRVGIFAGQPPYQYKNAKTGEIKGISVDMLKKISDHTGMKFDLVEAGSMKDLYQMARDGEVDMVACMPYDYRTAGEQRLSMTRPYVSSQYTLLMHESMSEGTIKGKRLAMVETSSYQGYTVGKIVSFPTRDACIRAVDEGEADYTYVDACTAQYYINDPEFKNLKMVPQTYDPSRSCFGVSKETDTALLTLLNKVILTMPAEELQAVIYANMASRQDFSLSYFIQENPIPVILTIAAVFGVFSLLMLLMLFQRIRANREMALELKKHLGLYAVANDYFFEFDYIKNQILFSEQKEGKAEEGLIKLDLGEAVPDSGAPAPVNPLREVLHAAENGVSEIYMLCRDGLWHWLRVTIEIIRSDSGAPVYAVGRINVIDDEKNEREDLRAKAQRDSLTHLYNTETCEMLIGRALAEMKEGEMGALLLLDVDKFKAINDSYGHPYGDSVLRRVADLLQRQFRAADVVGRPGGDEFIIYMSGVRSRAALRDKCESLCEAFRRIDLEDGKHVTISLGAAVALPGQTYGQLYALADEMLYEVKDAGRDSFMLAAE